MGATTRAVVAELLPAITEIGTYRVHKYPIAPLSQPAVSPLATIPGIDTGAGGSTQTFCRG